MSRQTVLRPAESAAAWMAGTKDLLEHIEWSTLEVCAQGHGLRATSEACLGSRVPVRASPPPLPAVPERGAWAWCCERAEAGTVQTWEMWGLCMRKPTRHTALALCPRTTCANLQGYREQDTLFLQVS